MFSIRSLTRSVPRTLSRSLTTSAFRPLQRSALFQPTWKLMPRSTYAPFSTSGPRFEAAGQVDVELAAKFQEELALETESGETEELPESLKYYLENGPFEIVDKAGEEEVVLTRKFGDEKIRISFTIADLQNINPEEDFADNALQDEMDMDPSRSTKGDPAAGNPEDTMDDQPLEPGYLARVDVTIEKPGKGAMHVDAVARDGLIQIENVSYFKNPELANAETPDKEWQRQSLYAGPPFGNLDEDLQALIERYLDERGVDTALASFVPDYIDFKEQKEYVRWLGSLKNFVGNN
ncbi:suaprga1 [Arthroderma uncinatum]|uniref:suaprga1 n=1 Tax=Arthroderma uncinatum TaxID=74035 RepID=UPI00144A7F0C|nr:suaprga1 [Arthroderma uncinatum]KAF3479964.1 suaprga1 [Arthroderma uncinatum]